MMIYVDMVFLHSKLLFCYWVDGLTLTNLVDLGVVHPQEFAGKTRLAIVAVCRFPVKCPLKQF